MKQILNENNQETISLLCESYFYATTQIPSDTFNGKTCSRPAMLKCFFKTHSRESDLERACWGKS